jgi:hypothetical protein
MWILVPQHVSGKWWRADRDRSKGRPIQQMHRKQSHGICISATRVVSSEPSSVVLMSVASMMSSRSGVVSKARTPPQKMAIYIAPDVLRLKVQNIQPRKEDREGLMPFLGGDAPQRPTGSLRGSMFLLKRSIQSLSCDVMTLTHLQILPREGVLQNCRTPFVARFGPRHLRLFL